MQRTGNPSDRSPSDRSPTNRPGRPDRSVVLRFVRPGSGLVRPQGGGAQGQPRPVEDLGKFEHVKTEADDYRHRQITNLAAFAVCVLLIVGGIWLANKIAELRRDQDCVLAGRRNCAQISVTDSAR